MWIIANIYITKLKSECGRGRGLRGMYLTKCKGAYTPVWVVLVSPLTLQLLGRLLWPEDCVVSWLTLARFHVEQGRMWAG